MRVGVFAHRLAQRHPTGIGRYLVELVNGLARCLDADTELLVSSTREDEPPRWVPRGVSASTLPWPRRAVQFGWCLGSGPVLERGLGKLDVLHLVQPFPPAPARARQVVTVHDLFPFEHPDWYRRSERWTYRRSMTLVLRRAARVVVPSRYVAGRLSDELGVDSGRLEVIHLGISGAFAGTADADVERTCSRFGVEPGCFAVSVGAVSTRKNVLPLVRAMSLLGAGGMPLLLIGPDGVGAAAVDAEIAKAGRTAKVRRTGFLPDPEAAALVRGAGVVVHPTLGEGFGFVPLEAMAVGTPVIAAGVSAVPEVVGDAAVLVAAADEPAAWASAIAELIGDRQLRESMIAAGRERARNFNWDKTAAAMLQVYRGVSC